MNMFGAIIASETGIGPNNIDMHASYEDSGVDSHEHLHSQYPKRKDRS